MWKIAGIIGGVVAILVVSVLGYAATKSNTFRVKRSIVINAPPEKIFPYVNDFHHGSEWSPFEARDANLKRTFAGAESGTGAKYAWNGNSEVGQGDMEILESVPDSKVLLNLNFTRPMECNNQVLYTLEPTADGTRVTWDMWGPNPYMSKVADIFLNLEKMVGKDFEQGLANLKTLCET